MGNYMSKNLIVKDNALINASYNLDLIEQRLILLAIVEARRTKQEIKPNQFLTICVSSYIDEFAIESKTKSVYGNIKNACKTLFERQFSYEKVTSKGNVEKVTSRWVQSISYVDKEAIVRIKFSDDVTPLITNLERQFTKYNLEQISDLNSKYSVRLYEILISWRSQGKTPMLPLDEIRYRFGLMANEYKTINDFKKWVLELAIKEINEKTDIQVSYEQHKQGRKIVGFTFTFKVKNAKKAQSTKKETAAILAAAAEQAEPFEVNPLFEKIAAYVTPDEQKAYLETYSGEQIAAIIERADEYAADLRAQGKKPRMGAVYAKAFAENWGTEKLLEKQELEKKKEAERLARQKELEAKQADEQQRLDDNERKRQAIEIFEMMNDDEKEAVLDEIDSRLASFFKKSFRQNRANGIPVYKDTIVAIMLKKIIFDD